MKNSSNTLKDKRKKLLRKVLAKDRKPRQRQSHTAKIILAVVFLGLGICAFFIPQENLSNLTGHLRPKVVLQVRQIGFALLASGGLLLWSLLIRERTA